MTPVFRPETTAPPLLKVMCGSDSLGPVMRRDVAHRHERRGPGPDHNGATKPKPPVAARRRAQPSQEVATAVVNLFIGIAIGTLLTASVRDPPGYD